MLASNDILKASPFFKVKLRELLSQEERERPMIFSFVNECRLLCHHKLELNHSCRGFVLHFLFSVYICLSTWLFFFLSCCLNHDSLFNYFSLLMAGVRRRGGNTWSERVEGERGRCVFFKYGAWSIYYKSSS